MSESPARTPSRDLWQPGALFHNFWRSPRRRGARQVDRLAGILANGIVSPAMCADGSVSTDLQIMVTGASMDYDRLVFLHRFGSQSYIYTTSEPGRLTLFVDPEMTVLTPKDMGTNWVILCQDEVYVRDRIAVEKIIGIVAHPADANSILAEFLLDFQRLGIPLQLYDGTTVWSPERR